MGVLHTLPFPPRADESARGLIVRIGEDNLASGTQISTWLGLPAMRRRLEGDVEGAAGMLGIDPAALAAMGAADEDGTEAFLGHRVPTDMLPRWTMRVCPACLAEEAYHRRAWDHCQLGVCPRHRLVLVGECAECRAEGQRGMLLWNRSDMLHCGAGHLMSEQPAAPAPGWRGHAAVYHRCGLSCDGPDFPEPFRALPLQPLLDLLAFLGRMEVVVARGNPDRISAAEMVTDPRILEAGAEITLAWPGSFGELAERVRQAHSGEEGLSRQYGYLHRFIQACGGQPYNRLLRDAYARHLSARDDMSDSAWPDFLPRAKAMLDSASAEDARRLLGLGRRPFRRLLEQPLWAELVPQLRSRTGAPQNPLRDVLELRRKLNRLVSPAVLDERLGLGRGKGRELCDAGLLPVHQWNRHNKRGENRSVDMADAEKFFEWVRGLCCPGAPERPLSFSELLNRAGNRRVVEFPDVMRAIVSGRLRGHVTQPWKPGFASLSFELEDAVQVLDELASPERCGKLRMGDVVRRLGVPASAVRELVAAGLLAAPDHRWA